jgi:tetratricopeptide (TPR) repeat protein
LRGLALAELGDLILRQDGDPSGAAGHLEEALRTLRFTREKSEPSPEELATLGSLATAWWALGRDDEALTLLHSAQDESPRQLMLPVVEATLWLARARATQDPADWERARTATSKAAALAPDHPLVQGLAGALNAARQ